MPLFFAARTQMKKLPEKLAKVIELFELTDNIGERVDLLMEYANRFENVPPKIATAPYPHEHLVPFCESETYVWVVPCEGNAVKLYFAITNPSALSAKALAVILDESLSGLSAEEIAHIPPELVYDIFDNRLSMGKGQGLMGIVSSVNAYARELMQKEGE
jgi:cysteine desulfuration protein SufE